MEWGWFTDSKMVHLFLYFLLKANYKDKEWKGVIIKRGQLVTGRKAIRRDTKISEQSIRTALERLKSTNEITIKSTSKYSIITICNYEKYQEQLTNTSTSKLTNQQPASNQQVTTPKESKEVKKKDLNGEFTTPPLSFEDKYKAFIDYFNTTKKRETGTLGRFKPIEGKTKAQFKIIAHNYTGKEIGEAVQTLFKTKHHIETNYQYATPELLTRSDKFPRFLENA